MENRKRDVELVELGSGSCLVVACDSCGAVGSKELDVVQAPPYVVGRYTARVALFEVLAAGAVPKAVSVTISNEPSPTGEEILQGVRDELKGLDAGNLPIAVSTEKNMATRQTAAGVTVMGVCRCGELRLATSKPGDVLYCLGTPKMGNEVEGPDDATAVRLTHLITMLRWEGIHDIIPVGSKGIQWEAETLADASGRQVVLDMEQRLNVKKSAGPCSCLVFSCLPGVELPHFDLIPLTKIGKLE